MANSSIPMSAVSSTHPGMSVFNSNQVGGKKRVGRPRRKIGRPSKKDMKRRAAAKSSRKKGKTARKSVGKKTKSRGTRRGYFF